MDKGIKLELLGIGVILLAIAVGFGGFVPTVVSIIGFAVVAVGCFGMKKDRRNPADDDQGVREAEVTPESDRAGSVSTD